MVRTLSVIHVPAFRSIFNKKAPYFEVLFLLKDATAIRARLNGIEY